MTKKVFWDDPYLRALHTRVSSVSGQLITVAETIFYPFSGGQESDSGSIGGCEVLEAEISGRDIFYKLPRDHDLKPGAPVEIKIDWDRRYALMRLHFAAELILELVYGNCPGIEKTGAHISETKARLDFLWPENISALFPDLMALAEQLICENRDITSAFSDAGEEKRYWEIEGFARIPCCGTHLRRTGEIGPLVLKRNNIGKGKERIEITLAET